MNGFWSTATLVALTAGLSAQTPGQAPAQPANSATTQEKPTFKVQVDLVTNDIIVRDEKGNFISDLKPAARHQFEILHLRPGNCEREHVRFRLADVLTGCVRRCQHHRAGGNSEPSRLSIEADSQQWTSSQ